MPDTSVLRRPGVVALVLVTVGVASTVNWVHRGQTRERQAMREAVLRDIEKLEKRMTKRGSMIDTYTAELSMCPEIVSAYIPPIVREKGGNAQFENEKRRVVIVFLSLPSLAKESVTSKGVVEAHLNDVYSALRSVLAKFEGQMRDFLFEDKGCTLIACFGITRITEVDAARASKRPCSN